MLKIGHFFLGCDDGGDDVPGGSLTWAGIVMTTKQLQTIPPYNKVKWCLFPPGDHLPLLIHPPPPSASRPQNFSIEQLNTSIYIIFKVSDPPGARRHGAISTNFFHKINLRNIYGNFTLNCPVLTKQKIQRDIYFKRKKH